jgi:chorismate mutase/prephenate dehydratase
MFGDRDFTFCGSFEDVFMAVQSGELDYGVLPVNNSTAGTVDTTYDLLAKYSVYIVREVCLDINHCLAAKADCPVSELRKVYSHPQALMQCSEFIDANGLKTADYGNTATAAEKVAASSPDDRIAAICSVDCAKRLGLNILAEKIADCSVNRTQFVCISRKMEAMPDSDIVSVMLKIPHTEGSLYRLLTKFYVNGMNLLRIENRPIRDGSFDVIFYLDFSGRISDPGVKALMNDLDENDEYFRILGTFRNE